LTPGRTLRRGSVCNPSLNPGVAVRSSCRPPEPSQHDAREDGDVFEQHPTYDAAYLAEFPTFEEKSGPAIKWASEAAGRHGCGITVVAPTRSHFQNGPVLSRLPSAISQETSKTLGRFPRVQPVTLAFWPLSQDLERLDDARGLKALVVVPWLEEDVATWIQARGAIDLLGKRATAATPGIADPVVGAAMRSLTNRVNLSSGLVHPRDKAAAVQALQVLKRNGHRYEPQELQTWAMANGWDGRGARQLSEYAAGVLAGKAYRTGAAAWGPDVMDYWREDAGRQS